MTIHLSGPIGLFLSCCAVPALAAAGEPAASTTEAQSSGSEKVCRVEKVLGSRLGSRRVCLTRDQWRAQRQQQRQDVEAAQRIKPLVDE